MMRCLFGYALAGLLLATPTLAAGSLGREPLTLERLFAAPDLSGPSLRGARFSPDGRLVTYLQGKADAKDRLDVWAYDIAAGRNRLLVDSARIVADEGVLSPEEEARRERARTSSLAGIVEYEFSPDSRTLLIPLAGDLYLYDLAEQRTRRLTATTAAETDARFSPRGRYVSFVREQNLYVLELATGRELAVTTDGGGLISFGMAEFIAQEEMDRLTGYWWAPDDSHLAFARVDETPVDELERFEIYAETVKVIRQRYPAAGRPNARVDLWIASIAGNGTVGTARELTAARDSGAEYLARVNWFPDSRHVAVQRQSRDQKTLELVRIAIDSGEARVLLTERSDTWVDLNDELTFLPKRRAFLWSSARSGFDHLYLYDYDGRLIRPVTAGAGMVVGNARERAIEAVDEQRGRVYFTGWRESPLDRHLFVAPLEGSTDPGKIAAGIRRLSTESGSHVNTLSRDARFWLDTFSTPETPPSLRLRRNDGRLIAVLVENALDATHPYAPHAGLHQPTEFGSLTASDGQTLYYQLTRPVGFQPGTRYPVIVEVYGGPTAQQVRRAWGGLFRQVLAQQGYVVFTIDNRGSGFRGRAFEGALHRRLGTVEVEDQVRGVEFLRTLPFVDAARIGVFGWSYGGYMALMTMVKAPDYFAAGVSGAPVTDWRLYDSHYTERYMSTPEDNPEGYREGNVMTHAANLRGPLLVMHGMADDNVLFTHSTALFKRLQELGKRFEVMPYPGSKHGLLRFGSTGPHGYATVVDFFERHLKPAP